MINIFLAGDSTVATNGESSFPQAGWGQFFNKFFNDSIHIENHAVNGRSTKSFIQEGRLDVILKEIKAGDFLFIQFGHNDEKEDAERHTDPETSFKETLKIYINSALAKGAKPVLITPVNRRTFNVDGIITNSHEAYYHAMKELAIEVHIPLIDLCLKSKFLFEELGVEGTKNIFLWLKPNEQENFPLGSNDNTHFSQNGAYEIAKLVIQGVKEENIIPLINMIV